jgi:pyrimidine-nucleoside phosphorylase
VSEFSFVELIECKRDGGSHTADEMDAIVLGFTRGEIPDYQMSAWLMATVLNGLSADETVWMTDAMVRSGHRIDLSHVPGIAVDKHSTGGVADTTTLVLAPLVASCGVPVAKMSGRGLGHTGGTLDKLESIPGFRVEMTEAEFVQQVATVGVAVIAQSPEIDPADKKIYALRDVTGTVSSIPLIVSSIVSKKVAGGAAGVVLDVKVGSGALMKSEEEARALASELVRVGGALGCPIEAVLSDMGQPLGNAIGNALEVREAIQVLKGEGPADLREVVLVLGSKMLVMGEAAENEGAARPVLERALESGAALRKFGEWVAAQGGDARIVDDSALLPRSAKSRVARAVMNGYIAGFDGEAIGRTAVRLGAGRETAGDEIDPAAGIQLLRRRGDRVEKDDPIAVLHAEADYLIDLAEERFLDAVQLSHEPVAAPPLVEDV